jgi:selenocysteine lyase/cysteine desulfurase
VEFGWTNVAGYNDYGKRDMELRPDAGRYECGTLNTIGCYGLGAAIDFLLGVGIEKIGPVVQSLGDQIAAGVERKGYELLGERTPATGAGIVSFRKKGPDSSENESIEIVEQLRAENIIVTTRAGWVRTSPHFYIEAGEIQKMLDLLP